VTVAARNSEPRIVRIADGVIAQVVERSVLPPRLDALLAALRGARSVPVLVLGTRRACTDESHAYAAWVTGVYGPRELQLSRCTFCGAVEVRDVSYDILPGLKAGRGGPRRRDDVLGWYSGSRPLGRTYL
jgi:hypothetical protein